MKIRKYWLLVLLLVASCKKLIDVKSSTDIDDAVVFSDDRSAITATVGQYAEFMEANVLFNGQLTKVSCLYADDLTRPFTSSLLDSPFLHNQLQASNTIIKEMWNTGFNFVYNANKVLKNLSGNTAVTRPIRDQLEGESRFLRALIYFYLVNLFGDVPLVLSINLEETRMLPRASEREVYDQIKKDLLEAVQLLPDTYPGKYDPPANRVRANKGAAIALLARVYLYLKDYPNAIAQSSRVIDFDIYKLESNLDNVFLAKSYETIFALYPTNNQYNTLDGRIFGGNSTKPTYALTDALLQNFSVNDSRMIKWMRPVNTSLGVLKIPNKYKVYESDQVIEYNVMLRLSEMYLVRAEANAGLRNYYESINDLNIIRNRAGVEPLPSNLNANEVITAIETENQREFFAELGHRWFDLRRWPANNNSGAPKNTRADEVLQLKKIGNWQPYMLNWPIPREEILKSSVLTQNEGYAG
jgi:starch-binding outer membrane protein, SusD/RagB family